MKKIYLNEKNKLFWIFLVHILHTTILSKINLLAKLHKINTKNSKKQKLSTNEYLRDEKHYKMQKVKPKKKIIFKERKTHFYHLNEMIFQIFETKISSKNKKNGKKNLNRKDKYLYLTIQLYINIYSMKERQETDDRWSKPYIQNDKKKCFCLRRTYWSSYNNKANPQQHSHIHTPDEIRWKEKYKIYLLFLVRKIYSKQEDKTKKKWRKMLLN